MSNRCYTTSAMMRAAERRRSAAIVFCLLGYFAPPALAKTLQEDTATEGKDAFLWFSVASFDKAMG